MTLRGKILLLGLLAITGMFVTLSLQYRTYATQSRAMAAVAPNVRAVGAFSQAVHTLQIERGLTASGFYRVNNQTPGDLFRDTDTVLSVLPGVGVGISGLGETLAQVRTGAAVGMLTPLAVLDRYSGLLRTIIDEMGRLAREFETAITRTDIYAHTHLVAAKEYLGQTRATLVYWIDSAGDDPQVLNRLIRLKSLHDEELRKFGLEASPELQKIFAAEFSGEDVRRTLETVNRIAETRTRPRELDAQTWWLMATAAVDRLKVVEDRSLDAIERKAEDELTRIQNDMRRGALVTLGVALAVIILAVSATVTLIRTLNRALASMELIAANHDFSRRIPADTPDEIGRISGSFNRLLDIAESSLKERENMASTDPLTGINNRLRFAGVLAEEAQRKRRTERPMTLIMFDIDHFKRINDSHGHIVGDDVLKVLASIVESRIRGTDFFGRWGGEEFVLLLRDEDCDAAIIAAEKLRKLIAATEFPVVGQVQCSFGVAAWRPSDTEESLIARADKSLYDAKDQGRNRVSCPGGSWESCRRRALCKE